MKNNKAFIFLALVFAILFSYWTFNQAKYYLDKENQKSFKELPDTSSASTENINSKISDQNESDNSNTTKEKNPRANYKTSSKWVANDYVKGDITEKPYTVKYGDTLWEIGRKLK